MSLTLIPPSALRRCAGLLACAALSAPALADEAYPVYINARTGYRIAYPPGFVPQGVAPAGDGQVFLSPDGSAQLRVFNTVCMAERGNVAAFLAAYANQEKAHQLVITYRAHGKGFAVVSGLAGDRVFYKKLLTDEHWCTEFSFDYESADSKQYDAVVARVAHSFKR